MEPMKVVLALLVVSVARASDIDTSATCAAGDGACSTVESDNKTLTKAPVMMQLAGEIRKRAVPQKESKGLVEIGTAYAVNDVKKKTKDERAPVNGIKEKMNAEGKVPTMMMDTNGGGPLPEWMKLLASQAGLDTDAWNAGLNRNLGEEATCVQGHAVHFCKALGAGVNGVAVQFQDVCGEGASATVVMKLAKTTPRGVEQIEEERTTIKGLAITAPTDGLQSSLMGSPKLAAGTDAACKDKPDLPTDVMQVPALALEHIQGSSLKSFWDDKKPNPTLARCLLCQTYLALAELVHRGYANADQGKNNIMVTPGAPSVRLIDFGEAKELNQLTRKDRVQEIKATFGAAFGTSGGWQSLEGLSGDAESIAKAIVEKVQMLMPLPLRPLPLLPSAADIGCIEANLAESCIA